MPPQARVNGGDSLAAGRARQRLKLGAIGYVNARHGVDADAELLGAAHACLCRLAVEFVGALHGEPPKNLRADLHRLGNSESLKIAAIAYASARHGIDADVGMAREGLALLCQSAIDYAESLPREDPAKRATSQRLQLSNGART